jgi:hypothetical protein
MDESAEAVIVNFQALFEWCDLHASRWRFHRPDLDSLLADAPISLSGHPTYYDRQGFPIPAQWDEHSSFVEPTLVWARMKEDSEYSRVAYDVLPDGGYLSTVWLGLDHAMGGPPLIFETMRFAAETEESPMLPDARYHPSRDFPHPADGGLTDQLRYRTEEEALAAHHEIVRRIRIREGH